MKVKGTIKAISEVQEGEGSKGAWAKRTIVLTDEAQPYANEFVLSLFKSGEHVDYAKDKFTFKVGDVVDVEYNSKANEFKGKWYGDLSIWKIEKLGAGKTNTEPKEYNPDSPDDLPF